jgi:ATP-binding cassette subfamily B (MDR/TAP) protein 1
LENIAHGLINSSDPEHASFKDILLGSDLAEVAADIRGGTDLMAAAEKRGPIVIEIVVLAKKAASLADADQFIVALQQGYGTVVGSSGRLISGGQKQRVALARALIKNPAVLILDEATASLDSRSEQRIQRAINSITSGRTVITIAHRLATITAADNIICMHKGRILQQGTHSELMASGGTYADMVKMQTLGNMSEARDANVDDISVSDRTSTGDIEKKSLYDETMEPEKAELHATETPVRESAEEEESDELPAPARSVWDLAKGYGPALRPHILYIFVAFIGSICVGGAFSGEAVIFGNTVGSLNPCNSPSWIRNRGDFFGLMFFILAIIEFFANLVSWCGFGWVSEKVVYTVRVSGRFLSKISNGISPRAVRQLCFSLTSPGMEML